MKRLVICIALMSSASAFAGPVQDGTILFLSGKAQVAKNKLDIALTRNTLKGVASDLKELEVKNDKLKKINAVCADKFMATAQETLESLEYRNVTSQNEDLSKTYEQLKDNAAKLEKAQNCAECDGEIKRMTVEKYLYNVSNNLERLKSLNEGLPAGIVEEASKLRFCDYTSLFKFEDSKKFSDLKTWGSRSYNASLSPSEVLSGEFNDTLDLILRKAPLKVERTATRFGSESSEYKNGVVKINISYDYSVITGYDNVRHAKVTNLLDIIQRDR